MQQKYITFAIGNQQTRVTAMINPQLLGPESIVVIGGSNNTHKPGGAIVRLSTLLRFATEIKEIDINPLLADADDITAVDARIRIEKHDAS